MLGGILHLHPVSCGPSWEEYLTKQESHSLVYVRRSAGKLYKIEEVLVKELKNLGP